MQKRERPSKRKRGLSPIFFFFNTGSRALFGIAESENYEMIDKMAIGGILGAAVSMNDWPVDSDTTTSLAGGHPRFGGGLITETSYSDWNTAIWGVAGAGLAHLAHKGGRVDNAIVQLRMIVQDTRNGEILWTNRAKVKTMTQSAFNKKDGDTLIEKIGEKIGDRPRFFRGLSPVPCPPVFSFSIFPSLFSPFLYSS